MSTENIELALNKLETALVSEALNRGWQFKYAKFGKLCQSLLVHSINTFSVTRIIGPKLFSLDDDQLYIACLAGFLHDIQKEQESWQEAARRFMRGERLGDRAFSHDDGSNEQLQKLVKFLTVIEKNLANTESRMDLPKLAKRILNIIVYTHDSANRAAASLRNEQVGPIDPLATVIRLCDAISSIKKPEEIVRRARDLDLPSNKTVSFEYHALTRIRGIVSSFLNEAIISLMRELGYEPLLHLSESAVYLLVGEQKPINNTKERLLELINEQILRFQESPIYKRGMLNSVIGVLTQTKWPCIQIIRKSDIPTVFHYLSGMPAMNKDAKSGKAVAQEKKNEKDITRLIQETKSKSPNQIVAQMLSDFNIFVYFVDFLKQYHEFARHHDVAKEYIEDINNWLKAHIGQFSYDSISDVSHNSKINIKVDTILRLWHVGDENLHLQPDRRERIVNGIIEVLEKLLTKYKKYAPPFISDDGKTLLLGDILHIPIQILNSEEAKEAAASPHDRYIKGKEQKERICSICGAASYKDAVAAIFGDGSQTFSNILPAGIIIGAGNKAQVCHVCLAEATLRSFFFKKAPALTFVVFPELSLSPAMFRLWSKSVEEFAIGERLGLSTGSVWNMIDIYDHLSRGNRISTAYELVSLLRSTNTSVDKLKKYLKLEYTDANDIKYEVVLKAPSKITHEALARAHLEGKIRIDPSIVGDFEELPIVQSTCYMTPGHMFVFFQKMLTEDDEESSSTSTIRSYLHALLLAMIFHARVVVVQGFEIISSFDFESVVKIDLPPPAAMALKGIGIEDPVRIHQMEEIIKTLVTLALIAAYYVPGLGKDRLLRIARMSRGAILRRAQMESSSKQQAGIGRLVTYLCRLPSEVQIGNQNRGE